MIYYTIHARARMTFRGITEDMIKSSLLRPDKIGTGYESKNLVFKKFGKKILKVVFKKKKSTVIIVSVIWD
jgi:hypothetical protein